MKRSQLVEFGIIAIGIICGYQFLDNTISVLFQLAYSYIDGSAGTLNFILPVLMMIAVYGSCFVLFIKKSRQIAARLLGNGPDEQVAVKADFQSLLYITFLGILGVSFLTPLPKIIYYLLETFKNEVSSKNLFTSTDTAVSKYQFFLAVLQLALALTGLYFAKTITGWFLKNNPADELSFESNPEIKE